MWVVYFEAAGAEVKIGSSHKPNHQNQAKLVQFADAHGILDDNKDEDKEDVTHLFETSIGWFWVFA